jgi:hypothetical protein
MMLYRTRFTMWVSTVNYEEPNSDVCFSEYDDNTNKTLYFDMPCLPWPHFWYYNSCPHEQWLCA